MQLVSASSCRKVYIDHHGERIPLLTANFSLGLPVIEENATTYTCNCSWAGAEGDCDPHK